MKILEISNEKMTLLEKLVADENRFYERTEDTAFTPHELVEKLIYDYAERFNNIRR